MFWSCEHDYMVQNSDLEVPRAEGKGSTRASKFQEQCPRLEVVGTSLKSSDAGSVKTWVHLLASHSNSQEPVFKETEWTVLMQITKDNLDEIDCLVRQHV